MKIEIIEFEEIDSKKSNDQFFGEMHIYIEHLDLDILGINVFHWNNSWFFSLPKKTKVDKKTGKKDRYNVVGFSNSKTYDDLISSLREEGIKFMNQYLLEQEEEKKTHEILMGLK